MVNEAPRHYGIWGYEGIAPYILNLYTVSAFPMQQLGFDPRSSYVGFMVDKMKLRQVFSE
jgi:hypothetical protein